MTTNIPTIMEDDRTITRISSATIPDEWDWIVGGLSGVTKIEPYEEYGWGSMVDFLAVYVGDEIRWRVPAASFIIEYAPTEEVSA